MRVREVLVVGACVTLLTGCAAEKSDLPGLTASPTPAVSSSAPEPTPTERTATDLSDPELGIVFDDIPSLTGPAASAYDAVAIYRVERWRSQTTGTVSPALMQFASPEILRKVEYGIQRNNEDGFGFDGVVRNTISSVVVDGATATASVCVDYSDVLFTHLDGSEPQSFDEIGFPQYELSTVRLSTFDGGVTWRPEDTTFEGDAC